MNLKKDISCSCIRKCRRKIVLTGVYNDDVDNRQDKAIFSLIFLDSSI